MTAITKRDIAAYKRGERKLMERAARRPILNPNGPTPLIPAWTAAERQAINQRHLNQRFGKG
jgi:hypothetical protein